MNSLRKSRSLSQIPVARSRSTMRFLNPNAASSKRSTSEDTRPSYPKKSMNTTERYSVLPYSASRGSSSRKRTQDLGNKDWQKVTWQKVASYFKDIDVDPKSLKPLSTKVFIDCTNLLLSALDYHEPLTVANYKEKLLTFLKMFGYEGQVTTQILNTIGVPYSFPRILAIWSWMIDLIDVNEKGLCFENHNFLKLYNVTISYFCKQFDKSNKAEFDVACNYFEQVYDDIYKEHEEIASVRNELQKEVSDLCNELNTLEIQNKEKAKNIKENKTKLSEYCTKTKSIKEKLVDRLISLENEYKEKSLLLSLRQDSLNTLKETIKNQKYNIKDKKQLLNQVNDLELAKSNLSERHKTTQIRIEDADIQISKLINQLTKIIYETNNVIREYAAYEPELVQLLISEKSITREGIFKELANIRKIKEQLINKAYDERVQQKATNNLLLEKASKYANLKKTISRLFEVKTTLKNSLEKIELEARNEISDLETTFWKLRDEINELKKYPSVKEAIEILQNKHEEVKKLKHYLEGFKEKVYNFLSEINRQNFELNEFINKHFQHLINKIEIEIMKLKTDFK